MSSSPSPPPCPMCVPSAVLAGRAPMPPLSPPPLVGMMQRAPANGASKPAIHSSWPGWVSSLLSATVVSAVNDVAVTAPTAAVVLATAAARPPPAAAAARRRRHDLVVAVAHVLLGTAVDTVAVADTVVVAVVDGTSSSLSSSSCLPCCCR